MPGGWVPCSPHWACWLSSSIRPGPHFRTNIINGVLIFPPSIHLFWNSTGGLFPRHFWSFGLLQGSGSPVTTTVRPTTGLCFWLPLHVPWGENNRTTGGSVFFCCFKTCTVISSTWHSSSAWFWAMTPWFPFPLKTGQELESGASWWPLTLFFWRVSLLAATRLGIWWEETSIATPVPVLAKNATRPGNSWVSSTFTTCSGPGSASSG